MFYAWFTLPTGSEIITWGSEYSTTFFSETVAIVIGVAVGVPVAILALKWLIGLVRRNVGGLFRGKRSRRR